MSDTDVVQSALKGDSTAFGKIVEAYQQSIYALVLSKIRDASQAQDLTQETFIRAYLNLESLTDPEKLGSWLAGIAVNVSYKWLERNRQLESLDEILEVEEPELSPAFGATITDTSMEEVLQHEEMRQFLWRGIYTLDDSLREVIVLFYVRRMKCAEIAQFMGISEGTVRNRLHKGRKQLKKEMLFMREHHVEAPELPEDFRAKIVEEAMARGEAYLKENSWEPAKQAFQRVVDVQEDHAQGYRGIGLATRGQVLEQLDTPERQVDTQTLEEAFTELSRAYRLGAKDWDTVWTLGKLYEQFGRCEEQIQIFLDYSQTAQDPLEAFKAGAEAAHEMGALCSSRYNEGVDLHQQLLKRYIEDIPPEEQFESYSKLWATYKEANRIELWLSGTSALEEDALPKLTFQDRNAYIGWLCDAYFELGRYEAGIEAGEAYINFVLNIETRHPHYHVYLVDGYPKLLLCYQAAGRMDKIEEAYQFIEQTLDDYEAEWKARVAELEGLNDADLHQWDEIYSNLEDLPSYPTNSDKKEIQKWMDEVYHIGTDWAYHNAGCGFKWIDEGEKAIHFFERKHCQDDCNHNMWMVEVILDCRKDKDLALTYFKRTACDKRWVASGQLRQWFEHSDSLEPVRDDPRFLEVINSAHVV